MQRRLSRIDFRIKAQVSNEAVSREGEVKNLSLNGMFIAVPDAFNVGEQVSVVIYLTTDHSNLSINVNGEVLRREDDGVALQFSDIELDSFIFLRNILAYNSGNSEKIDKEFREFVIWNSNRNREEQ